MSLWNIFIENRVFERMWWAIPATFIIEFPFVYYVSGKRKIAAIGTVILMNLIWIVFVFSQIAGAMLEYGYMHYLILSLIANHILEGLILKWFFNFTFLSREGAVLAILSLATHAITDLRRYSCGIE